MQRICCSLPLSLHLLLQIIQKITSEAGKCREAIITAMHVRPLLLLLLQLFQKIFIVHKHNLPAIRIGAGHNLGAKPRNGPRLPGDLAPSCLDLLCGLINVLCGNGHLGVTTTLLIRIATLAVVVSADANGALLLNDIKPPQM